MKLLEPKKMNFGRFLGRLSSVGNIVYYKGGLEELSLNVTNACPNACVFCIRDRDQGWGVSNLYIDKDPPIEEILASFDEEFERLREKGINLEKVKICGYGEPVLRLKDMVPIISHVRQLVPPVKIQLATTGWPYFRFISEDGGLLRKIVISGLTHVYLSINSADKDQYRKLVRPGIEEYDKHAFDDALRFGLLAKSLGLDVTLGFVNLPSLDREKVYTLAKTVGLEYRIREYEDG